jgi:hypothetical protein
MHHDLTILRAASHFAECEQSLKMNGSCTGVRVVHSSAACSAYRDTLGHRVCQDLARESGTSDTAGCRRQLCPRQRGVSSAKDASCCNGASASSAGVVSIRGFEVHRCSRAQCLPSLSKSLTVARSSKETSRKKNSAPDASTVQAHNRARCTHFPRIPIQPDLPARLSCSRPKLASARPKVASTYRAAQLAQLPRACCKLESRITTARLCRAGRQRGCTAQTALARSSLAEDGSLRCSCWPRTPLRLCTADPAAGGRVHGNSAIHRRCA